MGREVLLLLVASVGSVWAQGPGMGNVGLGGGIGVTIIRATDVVDYINAVSPSSQRLDDFASAGEFFGTAEIRIDDSWGLKVEYAYLIKSYTVDQGGLGNYEYFYAVHMPTLMAQYLDEHQGYAFKFGGGLGYHVASFSKTLQGAAGRDMKSAGLGFKIEAEGNTALGEQLYGYIAGDVRGDFMGSLKDSGGNVLQNKATQKDVTMSFFAFGLKFGMIYYF